MKYNINLLYIFLILSFIGFSQAPERLIRSSNSQNDISYKPIYSKDRKVSINNDREKEVYNFPSIANKSSSSEAGRTQGSFSVALNGSATYKIPVATPQGIKSINPNITIEYNSMGGNGVAGWGWNIGGVSSITRVSATKFHDGFIDGVDLDLNDRYALDGQRLLLKSGTTYGAPGSEYQTEKYSNVRVIAPGPYGTIAGPHIFNVLHPDGTKAVYEAKGFLNWVIISKEDPLGNIIEYDYIQDNNTFYVSKIRFGSKINMTAPVEIDFFYKNRNRPDLAYVKGYEFKTTKILDKIEVQGNAQLFRKYQLNYDITSFGYENLTSVQEFNRDNAGLTPITFTYDNSATDYSPNTISSTIYPGFDYQTDAIASGEFSGDGKMDFITYNKTYSNKINIFENIYSQSINNIEIGKEYNVPNFEAIFSNTMLNHEGKMLDQHGITMVTEDESSGVVKFKSYYNSPTSLSYQYEKTWYSPTYNTDYTCENSGRKLMPRQYVSGDFNGDGLTDVLAILKPYTATNCYLAGSGCDENRIEEGNDPDSSKKGTITERRPDPDDGGGIGGGGIGGGDCNCYCGPYTIQERSVHFIDLNRNLSANGMGAGALQESMKADDRILTGDFNGDGKTDLFHFTEGKVSIYELDQDNRISLIHVENDSYIKMDKPVLLGDYNGDGKIDFLIPTAHNSSVWKYYFSKGNSIYSTLGSDFPIYKNNSVDYIGVSSTGNLIQAFLEFRYVPLDYNKDGKTDIIVHQSANGVGSSSGINILTVSSFANKFSNNDSVPRFESITHYVQENTGNTSYGMPILLDFDNANDNIEYAYISANNIVAYEFKGNHRKDISLKQINNNGLIHQIDYKDLSYQDNDPENFYTKNFDEVYPFININISSSINMVKEIREIGGGFTKTQNFRYTGAVSHAHGLGFMGYKQLSKTNLNGYGVNRLWNVNDFDTQKRGAVIQTWSSESLFNTPTNFISKTNYSYQTQLTSDKVFINVPNQITEHDGLTGTIKIKSYAYDQYYNPLTITQDHSGGNVETLTYTYSHNPSSPTQTYHVGRLLSKEINKTFYGVTHNVREEYNYSNSLMTQVKKRGNGTPWLTEDYQFDMYGNIIERKLSGSGFSDRIESFEYDSSGRYLIKSTNLEGQEITYSYEIASGNPLSSTDSNGLTTSFQYDGWNRLTRETDYLGKHTYTTYSNSSEGGTGGVLKYTNFDQGSDEKVYYNTLGWIVKKSVLGFNNKWKNATFEYDAIGRSIRQSEPYFGNTPSQWNTTSYDLYGRKISEQSFTGRILNTTYSGLSATVDDGVRTVTNTQDVLGNIASLQDMGGTISYTYHPTGVVKTTNYDGHIISTTIDGWGRKIGLTDPSAGNYSYTYNILGELLTETTPKGTTTYTYDTYGKVTDKQIVGDLTNLTLQYNYHPTSKQITSINGMDVINNKSYTYAYEYDNFYRNTSVTETTDQAIFKKISSYDDYGRLHIQEFNTNELINGTTSNVKYKYNYDSYGTIINMVDYDSSNIIWQLNDENAKGQTLSSTLGNGINKVKSYDQYGFLTNISDIKPINGSNPAITALKVDYEFNAQRGILNKRKNYAFNWEEEFIHDDLDRLTQISGPIPETKAYDLKGRITNNSSIGDYGYVANNTYRLAEVDLNTQGDLYYQQNNLQQVTYNAFKKPIDIFEEGKGRVSFEYGPLQNRTHAFYGGLQVDKTQRDYHKIYSSISPVEVTIDNVNSGSKIVTYVGGDAYSASIAYVKQVGGLGIDEYYYLHRDYLGSILAITDSNAVVKEQRQFGAWGTTDQFVNEQQNVAFGYGSLLNRGFTGHEHFFDVGLIHMNGRMYDAKLGRFLSPDNYVQDIYNTQSYNRYGYVWNNPLSLSDPSGEVVWAAVAVGAIIGMVSGAAGYAAAAIRSGTWDWGSFGLSVLSGAVIGGLTYGISPSLVAPVNLWALGASSFVAGFLPSFSVPIGDWNVNMSIAVAFGNASGVGGNIGVGYSDGNWSFSGGIGFMDYTNYNGFGSGTQIRRSIMGAYDDGRTGFSLGTNFWSGTNDMGTFKQQTGILGMHFGDFRATYENDGTPFDKLRIGKFHFLADGGDSHRTAAVSLSVGEYSIGFNLFTGYRNLKKEEKLPGNYKGNPNYKSIDKMGRNIRNGYVEEDGPRHRLGALSFRYKGYQFGVNSEKVRHAIQNHAIHNFKLGPIDIRQRMFENQSWNWNGYMQYTTPNNFTSW